jgi:fumarate hydratase subunit beta
MGDTKAITTPLTDTVIDGLRIGDHVAITGTIYTARDAAHKRLIALANEGKALPIDLRGQIIYYVGPTPPRPGAVIGSAGPTTAMRLDPYTPKMLELGLKGIIGKGGRGPVVRNAIQQAHAVYLIAVGGTGALLNRHIKSAEVIAFEDLGTEAIRKLEVDGFPAIVVNDCVGGDLLEAGKAQYRTSDRPIPAVQELAGDGGGR